MNCYKASHTNILTGGYELYKVLLVIITKVTEVMNLNFSMFRSFPEVKGLPIDARKCRFVDEYEGIMRIFKFYTR